MHPPQRTIKPLNPDNRAIAGRNPLRNVAYSLSVALAKVRNLLDCHVLFNERVNFFNERAYFFTFANLVGGAWRVQNETRAKFSPRFKAT